jgi:hypothetical protein
MAFKTALHCTMLEGGLDITLHGTRALNAVVECDTSAGDKLAGHTLGEFYGLSSPSISVSVKVWPGLS